MSTKLYPIREKNFHLSHLSQVNVPPTPFDEINFADRVITDSGLCFLLDLILLSMTISAIFMLARSEIFSLESLQQYPCKKCRFFSNNPYIKCAVHPYMALTQKAINCSDYWSK